MGSKMIHLNVREDEWSVQITAPDSKRFFVRISTSKDNMHTMVFSDFILDQGDADRAQQALHLIKQRFYGPAHAMKLVFQDICPSYSNQADRPELIRRHDQIVNVLKKYASETGLAIDNAFLEQKGGKFDTVIMVA